jgi:catechol 2,3-dioxygenase-like lactoylglutathione lyase family enzyme
MRPAAQRLTVAAADISRRMFMTAASAACALLFVPTGARAQRSRQLPLRNLGLEHLDIVVPDTAASARFYQRVFSSALYQQEFRGTIRYFVLLGDLPPDRQVGYIAIGALTDDRPIAIGHYCALAQSSDIPAIGSELATAGYTAPRGDRGMLPDPDGLQLQLFTPPAGLVAVAVPSALVAQEKGLLSPLGMDHVLLQVSDMERSLAYYRFVYGKGLESRDPRYPNRIWFELAAGTRVGLEPVAADSAPRIERFGIKVAPFDYTAVTAALQALGAEVLSGPDERSLIRFRDNYGITVEVNAV